MGSERCMSELDAPPEAGRPGAAGRGARSRAAPVAHPEHGGGDSRSTGDGERDVGDERVPAQAVLDVERVAEVVLRAGAVERVEIVLRRLAAQPEEDPDRSHAG